MALAQINTTPEIDAAIYLYQAAIRGKGERPPGKKEILEEILALGLKAWKENQGDGSQAALNGTAHNS